jgi:hypothetical protein
MTPMSPTEITALIALSAYPVYKESRVSQVEGQSRFNIAIIYTVVAVTVGGFTLPTSTPAVLVLAFSLLPSVSVGFVRGCLTRVWMATDGTVLSKGTILTVGLFVTMVVVTFTLGAYADIRGIRANIGFGGILLMIAAMVAAQAETTHARATKLRQAVARVELAV